MSEAAVTTRESSRSKRRKVDHPEPRRGAATYQRKRGIQACQICRGRRTKCDGKRPKCTFCEEANAECVYDALDHQSYDRATLAIIDRLDRLERTLQGGSKGSLALSSLISDNASQDYESGLPQDHLILLPRSLQDVMRWPVFDSFTNSSELTRLRASASEVDTPQRGVLITDLDLQHCRALLDRFFNYVHIKNPVFDESATRNIVLDSCLRDFPWDAESCLALLVYANGAIAAPFDGSEGSEPAETQLAAVLFRAAEKRFGAASQRGGLLNAQCMFLAGVYLMCKLRAFDAWRMFLQGLSVCQAFRCAKRPAAEPESPNGAASLEERIYWSSWKSERELRQELGLADFASLPLDHPSHFPALPHQYDKDHLRPWYFYLSEISLWRLNTTAMRQIVATARYTEAARMEALADLVPKLSDNVVEWQKSLAPVVDIEVSDDGVSEDDVLCYCLRGHRSNYYELVFWPFIEHSIMRPDLVNTRTRGLVGEGLKWHFRRLTTNSPGFRYRHHGTWLMQRPSSRSALVLLAAALTPSISDLLPSKWEEIVQATIGMIRFWSSEIVDAEDHLGLLEHVFNHETRPRFRERSPSEFAVIPSDT